MYCRKNVDMMLCAIWYDVNDFKKIKNTHRGVLLLMKLQSTTLLSVTLFHGCISHF